MPMFRVNEHFSGFEVEHIETGKTHWMSDGVDVISCSRKRFVLPDTKSVNVSRPSLMREETVEETVWERMLEVLLVGSKMYMRCVSGGTLEDRYTGEIGDFVAGPMPVKTFREIVEWFAEATGDDEMMSPGDPEFCEAWEDSLNSDEQTTLEAYFPEIYAKQE